MLYADMLPEIKTHKRILVTGPQRSGTTIATRILAQDLGLPCLLEEAFDTTNVNSFFKLLDREPSFVLQAPSMAALCHYLEEVTIIFMRRDLYAILRSQERIGWAESDANLERMRYFETSTVPPASLKYYFWDTYQRHVLQRDCLGYDLDYESLSQHPLWLDQDQRVNFSSRQTTLQEFPEE